MKKLAHLFLTLLMTGMAFTLQAQLRLPALISDHMVLQQEARVPLWGWDQPGESIEIFADWLNEAISTRVGSDGKWQLEIPTPPAGGPYAMEIKGTETIRLKNVLIGEVWLCSGQSNMEMPLEGWAGQPITASEESIAEADYPEIHLFTVKRKVAYEPEEDCEGFWAPCSPDNAGGFSATAFFFGVHLFQALKVPIGLIHSSWGGTPAEAWTSKTYIERIPYFLDKSGTFDPESYIANKKKNYGQEQRKWMKQVGFDAFEKSPAWTLPDFDASGWKSLRVPASWDDAEIGKFEGVVFQQIEIPIPRKLSKKVCVLELGPIDEMDVTWVNGIQVGEHLNIYDWPTPRKYVVPAGTFRPGKNRISVLIANTSGLGGMNGKPGDLKVYAQGKPESAISLSGTWRYQKDKSYRDLPAMPYCVNCSDPETPTTLYNGMIAPLIPYRIKGAIWYQGESNRYDGELYAKIFPNMITNWRQDWGQGDFPFYYVQIAPYSYSDKFSTGLLREAQLHSMQTPNTGMVVTMDAGSLTTIHPPDKKTVGQRLANWALAKNYGYSQLEYSGPIYKAWKKEDSKIRVYFDYAEGGLKSAGGDLKHFMIAGSDMKFVEAQAIVDEQTVLVWSDAVSNPIAVRFGWNSTDQTNLFNKAGLPASPFRTDQK